jgi:hypothetical protein
VTGATFSNAATSPVVKSFMIPNPTAPDKNNQDNYYRVRIKPLTVRIACDTISFVGKIETEANMIQIQRAEQFNKAAARLTKERMRIARHEPGFYRVENSTKGHTYHVRITRRDGLTFGACTYEAGTPSRRNSAPMVCKHLAAIIIYLRAIREMRRRAH